MQMGWGSSYYQGIPEQKAPAVLWTPREEVEEAGGGEVEKYLD